MKQRILTAAIALIVVVPLIIYGGLPFLFAVYLIGTIALYELTRMYVADKGKLYTLVAVLFLWMFIYPTQLPFAWNRFEIIVIFLLVLLVITVLTKNRFTFDDASFLLFATLFMGSAFHALLGTRIAGLNYLLFVLVIIWATDSGAYFVGKTFGKRKLWPKISPNKTIEGAIGGIVLALITGSIFQLVYPFDHLFIMTLLITLIISIVGQIGDLVASAIKRHYEVKDSGKLFPGHGGVLDRLDSLLFVLILLKLIHFI